MGSNKKTVAGNRSYRGEIPFTNIRVIYLGGRRLQIIDFYRKIYKKSSATLKTRKQILGTNAVKRRPMDC